MNLFENIKDFFKKHHHNTMMRKLSPNQRMEYEFEIQKKILSDMLFSLLELPVDDVYIVFYAKNGEVEWYKDRYKFKSLYDYTHYDRKYYCSLRYDLDESFSICFRSKGLSAKSCYNHCTLYYISSYGKNTKNVYGDTPFDCEFIEFSIDKIKKCILSLEQEMTAINKQKERQYNESRQLKQKIFLKELELEKAKTEAKTEKINEFLNNIKVKEKINN